jgi:acyl transferase domain-containing protein
MEPIAIVGVSCRFPGKVNDKESFWKLLTEGIDAITEIPADRWSTKSYYGGPEASKQPAKSVTKHGGFIDDASAFDCSYFGISPKEAANMDPQQRVLLELAVRMIYC